MPAHRSNDKTKKRLKVVGGAVAVLSLIGFGAPVVADKLVTSPDIKDGAVHSPDIADNGVRSPDIRDGGVHWRDLSPGLKKLLKNANVDDGGDDQADNRTCMASTEVDYAVNSDDEWQVKGAPFSQRKASVRVDESVKGGALQLDTSVNGKYADAGVIAPWGTVNDRFALNGTLKNVPNFKGTGDVKLNLYLDMNGDGDYLDFSGGTFVGSPSNTVGPNAYEYTPSGDVVIQSVDETTDLDDLKVSVGDETKVWVWAGVSGNEAQTATLNRLAGKDLVIC